MLIRCVNLIKALLAAATLSGGVCLGIEGERHHAKDGDNCAALLTRLSATTAPGSEYSIRSLADAAILLRRSGLRAAVYRMRVEDPNEIPAPSIVFLETPNSRTGRFAVFLGISQTGSAIVFDGATTVVEAMSTDQFLRTFTGHGVEVKRPLNGSLALAATRAACAALLAGSVYFALRCRWCSQQAGHLFP